jgi:hypothetical protein
MAFLKKDYSSSLVAKYSFEETSGTTCVDSTGNYNGTYNGTTSVVGESGNARNFNNTLGSATSIDYITFTNPIIPLGKKSIMFKIKYSTSISYAGVLGNFSSSGNDTGLLIQIYDDCVNCIIRNGADVILTISSNVVINDDVWHTVLFTIDDSGNAKLYIDDLCTPNVVGVVSSTEQTPSSNFIIGTRTIKTYGYNGELDEVEIYNEAIEYVNGLYLIQNGTDVHSINPTLCKIGQEPVTKEMFNKYGSEDLLNMTNTLNESAILMDKVGALESGNEFECQLTSEMLSIKGMEVK